MPEINPHDRNPDDPYHRVRQRGSVLAFTKMGNWYCTKCGAEFSNQQAAEEHEANRGWEE